jgi:predicted N-acyltransferase
VIKWRIRGCTIFILSTMKDSPDSAFDVRIAHGVAEVGPPEWDALSGKQPFQSHRWYTYGERCMADCPPFHIILYLDKKPAARVTFYLVRKEPLPLPPPLRTLTQAAFRRWPLLICRSPLAGLPGLILPDPPLREAALAVIARAALAELRRARGSFLIFDYLTREQTAWPGWPRSSRSMAVSDPNTRLTVKWDSFAAYLAAGNKKDRQHYKRSLRQAETLGIKVTKHETVPDMNAALALIHNVERKHGSAPNPWARRMLENLAMVNGTFLAAHIEGRLVGCGMLAYDNGAQLAAALGLAEDVTNVYFQLVYASLQDAFEKKARLLRWGSGAYEVKRRLGFEVEGNNYVMLGASNWIFQSMVSPA